MTVAFQPATSLGLAFLARAAFEGAVTEIWEGLVARFTADAADSGALLDISTLLQLTGDRAKGLEVQAAAIADRACYRTVHGTGGGLRILAFMTPGDMMANTPLDFLLEGSNAELITCYVDGQIPSPGELPDHDVAFLAIGQSDEAAGRLEALAGAFDGWPRPVINGAPLRIAALTRDGIAARFAGHPRVLCPATRRVGREALARAATSGGAVAADLPYPVIVRPIGSHAGKGLEKLAASADLATYLAEYPQAEFYVSAFFDYRGERGLYRKLRVVLVGGAPFISHMAVSERWMVHYLNADMDQAANRAEEAQMMATFDEGFAARHREAFQVLNEAIGLDYYGIDCAETADGRLLVFETDVAMIVHSMDPPDLYPYKKLAMAKLFAAFVETLGAATSLREAAA
jgi:hypothetical protein